MVVPSKIALVVLPSFMTYIAELVVGTSEGVECVEKEGTETTRRYTIIHKNETVTVDIGVRTYEEDNISYTEFKVLSVGRKRRRRTTAVGKELRD
jgi:hypothetical protein